MLNGQTPSCAPQIREALVEMCRPFGSIKHWAVDWADESINDGLYRCLVKLDEPSKHELVARTLGGELKEDEVCLEIRLRQ